MNAKWVSFSLFLLWLGVALTALVIGPMIFPRMLEDWLRAKMLGGGATLLAIWNFVKWWSLWQRGRERALRDEMEEAYRQRVNPPVKEVKKPILNPEFNFGEENYRLPPPPPPNGTAH